MILPICAYCTRRARTTDTPRVKVRVDRAIVYRTPEGLRALVHCHSSITIVEVHETISETDLEATEVFRGEG